MKIGFIGLGNMGGPMAKNLVAAGHQVNVFDLMQAHMDELAKAGATPSNSALEATNGAEVVISMLPAGKHVRGLYQELGAHLAAGTLVIDASTIDAQSARDVAQGLSEYDVDFIDAPVSGGVAGAAAGTLTFIVGGSEGNFNKALPVLEAMGKNIFHAGDVGAGQVAKICNNMLLAILMTGTSEALNLGIANGLDPKVLSDIMQASSGRNWTLELYNPCPGVMDCAPASNDYQGGFMLQLMQKDLGLALDTAQQSQASTPMGAMARNLYAMHGLDESNLSKDFSCIFDLFAKKQ